MNTTVCKLLLVLPLHPLIMHPFDYFACFPNYHDYTSMCRNSTVIESDTTSCPPNIGGANLGKIKHSSWAVFESRNLSPLESYVPSIIIWIDDHEDRFPCTQWSTPMCWDSDTGGYISWWRGK